MLAPNMYKVLIFSIVLFAGCQKESSSNMKDSETDISIIEIELKDSVLVGNNIFDISYNEIFEQPNWLKFHLRLQI